MKLTDTEIKSIHTFDEYYKHLCKSKMLDGIGISEDEQEIKFLNAIIAGVLTVIKGKEIDDYFA